LADDNNYRLVISFTHTGSCYMFLSCQDIKLSNFKPDIIFA